MAINPVVIEFLTKGMPDIGRAFRSVEGMVTQSEGRTTRAVAQGSRNKEREYQKLAREAARWQRDIVRDAEKAVKDEVRAEERAARSKAAIRERSARMAGRFAAQQATDEARIRAQDLRETERTEAAKTRAIERAHAQRARDDKKNQEASKRSRVAFVQAVGGAAFQGARAAGGRIFDITRGTAGLVTQLGGGFGIADSVERSSRSSGQLEDILNSAVNKKSVISSNWRRRESGEVLPQIQSTAIQYGMERSDVQAGLGSFTGVTGDMETALKLMPQLAELARATGSNFDELSQASGNVGNAFDDMTDSGKKAEKIMEVMRTLAGQGKAGNVELRDQSVQAAKLIASAGKFEGDNAGNITKLGAIMQAARGGGGAWNAASAATAVTSFTATFGKGARRDAFKAEGISLDGADGRIRAPEEIIADSVSKTGGDITRMNKLFGSVMSDRAVAKYTDVYRKSEAQKKGTGRKAVLDEIAGMTNGVAMTKADVSDAARRRVGALDARMTSARQKFDQQVEERLIPKLLELVPVIEQLVPQFIDLHAQAMPAFVDLIKTIADFASKNKDLIHDIAAHPIGTIIAAEVTKSIAAAAIGEGVKSLLLKLIGGSAAPPGGAGAGAGAGTAAAGAAAAVATYAAYRPQVDALLSGQTSGQMQAGAYISMLKSGDAKQRDKAIADFDALDSSYGGVKGANEYFAAASMAQVGAAYGAVSGEKNFAAENMQKTSKAREIIGNDDLRALVTALKENTAATKASASGGGNGSSTDPAVRTQPITNRASK